jgi:hypothetical protein
MVELLDSASTQDMAVDTASKNSRLIGFRPFVGWSLNFMGKFAKFHVVETLRQQITDLTDNVRLRLVG